MIHTNHSSDVSKRCDMNQDAGAVLFDGPNTVLNIFPISVTEADSTSAPGHIEITTEILSIICFFQVPLRRFD